MRDFMTNLSHYLLAILLTIVIVFASVLIAGYSYQQLFPGDSSAALKIGFSSLFFIVGCFVTYGIILETQIEGSCSMLMMVIAILLLASPLIFLFLSVDFSKLGHFWAFVYSLGIIALSLCVAPIVMSLVRRSE